MRRWVDILHLRVRSLFRRSAVDRDLARELRFHLDQRVRELVDEGVAADEARRMAAREFGSTASIEQQCRETRRVGFVTNLAQDLRYACRMLIREPILAAAGVTSIALGVGVNLTIFGLGNTLLMTPPTAAEPERLVNIRTTAGSHASHRVWRALDESAAVAAVAGHLVQTEVNWRGSEQAVAITPSIVTANYFDLLRVPLLMGRAFTRSEAEAERQPRLAVLGHRFWSRRLAANPAVVGGTITLNGEPFEVLGVLAPGTRSPVGFGIVPDVYLPITPTLMPGLDSVNGGHVQLVGRLHEGQSPAQAHAALAAAAARAASELGAERDGRIRSVVPFGTPEQARDFRPVVFFFLALMVVTILVLTIACANVAGLLLARSTARRREIAIRFAVGATRGRLVQQLLTEGIVLSLSGVGVGLLLTVGAGTIFRTVSLPLPLPIEFDVDVTGRLIWLAAGLVVVSALLSALTPALHATQPGVTPALKQQVTAYAHRRFTMRGLIVCGQVAVSLVLLIVTLLFARNLTMANALAPGFDVDRLVVADVTFVEGRQGTQADPAIAPIVDRLGAIPGVEGAAFASSIPLTPTGINRVGMRLTIEGHAEKIPVDYSGNRVGPGFFRTMGIPIRRGREFLPTDRPGSPLVIVISEEFARRYFAGMDPIGRRVHIPTARDAETPAEVIGIAGDGKYRSLGEGKQPAIYEAYVQRRGAERRTNVVVRTAGPPAAAVAAVRAMMLQMDPSAAVNVQPMTAALSFAFLPSQIGAALMGSLGVLGVVLAMVGLYGVIAFNAGRRAPEIAVRMALGATRGSVLRLVLADTGWLAGVGMAVGVALAMAATPLLTAFLVADLSASDPLSFALALLLLGATSLAAAWRPARRSMRIEPAAVLRSE